MLANTGSLVVVASLLGLLYIGTIVSRLLQNIIAAKRTGLPYLVYPVDPNSLIWLLTAVPLRPWLKRNLPKPVWDRLTLTIYGWEFHEKRRPFERYAAPQGDDKSIVVAGSGTLELWTADPMIATEVLKRSDDFEMPPITGILLGQFGHNVLTSNGDKWAKQRKVVAAVINERISKTVFDATMRQTKDMLQELLLIGSKDENQSAESDELFDMIKRITIHVLSEAGMGTKAPWKSQKSEKAKPGFSMTYIESCRVVMESVTGAIVVPTAILLNWPSWLPGHKKMKQLAIGKTEFPLHTKALLNEERQRISESKAAAEGRSNIMSQLIRASAEQVDNQQGLTEDELNGNLFLFTAAGFETTANTLSYACMMLARYPQWQEWLFDEIDNLMPPDESGSSSPAPEYTAIFPQVRRITAVMFETLRLYTPVVHVVRTNKTPQELKTSKGLVVRLPANSNITINNIALHLDPEVWRDINHESDPPWVSKVTTAITTTDDNEESDFQHDEYTFRPSRWLSPGDSTRALYQPPKGYFVPWGYGPRICPGQRMGQVEFAAAILKLLQCHRLEAVALEGETTRDVERRLDRILNNSISKMTLIMEDVYDARERGGGVAMRLRKR